MENQTAWADRVLVVDDEEDIRDLCSEALTDAGFEVETAPSVSEALTKLESAHFDMVLTDMMMPGVNGIELLRTIKGGDSDLDVVVMTGYATVATAVECLKLGAYDYLAKPFALDDLVHRVRQISEKRALTSENRLLRTQAPTHLGPAGMIGGSAQMQEVYRLLARLAIRNQPVLVTGESGTGKELAARALHELGPHAKEPFVAVDCGALSATLMDSELFGHRQGAFTGATQTRAGLLASAGRGTIFLDEIGELPIDLQAKLLRALQEKEYRPLGSNASQQFHARVVAATNRDLMQSIRQGRFRSDLYYRLNVLAVNLPPLRERKEDIPALVRRFLERAAMEDEIPTISAEAVECLRRYDWPGNIRELQNHVLRAMAVATGSVIRREHLAPELRSSVREPAKVLEPAAGPATLDDLERDAILRMLEATGGNRLTAARRLGIGKTTMYKKLKEYGLTSSS